MTRNLNEFLTEIKDYGKTNKARERIESLLDENSFVEKGVFVRADSDSLIENGLNHCDGVVCGYGTIAGRLVFIYALDINVAFGSISYMNGKKIEQIYDDAMKVGAPVIALLDSDGIRISESFRSIEGFSKIIKKYKECKNKIITLTGVFSNLSGLTSLLVNQSDFSVKLKSVDVTLSPKGLINTDKNISDKNGAVDLVVDTEDEVLGFIRDMLSLLPDNKVSKSIIFENDDPLNRDLTNIDMKDISSFILDLFDDENVMELKKNYSEDIYTFIGTIGGILLALVVTSSNFDYISYEGVRKISDFVKKSNNLNIPIITIVDSKGFDVELSFEERNYSGEVYKMIESYLDASVPKITLYAGECIGSAYFALASKHIGSDVVLAFEDSKIAVINSEVAVKTLYKSKIEENYSDKSFLSNLIRDYEEQKMNVFDVARYGYIDDIIYKESARKRIIAMLDMLSNKER